MVRGFRDLFWPMCGRGGRHAGHVVTVRGAIPRNREVYRPPCSAHVPHDVLLAIVCRQLMTLPSTTRRSISSLKVGM